LNSVLLAAGLNNRVFMHLGFPPETEYNFPRHNNRYLFTLSRRIVKASGIRS